MQPLFRKYLENNCSPEEVDEFISFLKDAVNKHEAGEMIEQHLAGNASTELPVDPALQQRLQTRLQSILAPKTATRVVKLSRWMAAAAVILLLAAGAWFWLDRNPKTEMTKSVPVIKDIPPGGNKAILTLADGSSIILDSAANGRLAEQGKTVVTKAADGQLVYAGTGENIVLYNTLATPRGGQYQLVLPDGSKVWLNAASSIRYPTAFTGNERKVDITGEAYFEVAKNAKPFRVVHEKTMIEVLGTHFNVNAYNDEPFQKTTLLEGSIKLTKDAASVILKPGEQASVSNTITVHAADIDEAVAWKNGNFYFNGADLQTIMRQVSRWYDVEVVYEGKIPEGHFRGKPTRDVSLSQLLTMLETTGIQYKIEGKKIIIRE